MRLCRLASLGIVLVAGCLAAEDDSADGNVEDSFQDDDLPMGGCSGTGCATDSDGGGPRVPVGEPCDGANQCASGSCAATFRDGNPGPLTCHAACIEAGDADAWCSDDASCCDGLVCAPRGLCVAASDPDGGSEAGEEGSSGGADG